MSLDGRSIAVVDVTATQNAPQTYEVHDSAGLGQAAADGGLYQRLLRAGKSARRRDRNLVIEAVRVEGMVGQDGQMPDTHRRIIFRDPAPDDRIGHGPRDFVRICQPSLSPAGEADEVDRLMKLYELARGQNDNFNEAIRLAVEAVLVSPQFLFRLELDPPAAVSPVGGEPAEPVVRAVGDYELASRLSYFLWSSLPDEQLLSAAAAGQLHDRASVAAQARRMLADPKSQRFVENFIGQWLELRRLAHLTPSKKLFPDFDHFLGDMMREETERFFAAIVAEDRSVLDLLDADFTFVNERLARHYGIEDVKGKEFRRVQLTGGQRGGLLTQGSILTLTSNPNRTSPVKRGKWVLENLLGTTIPNPPPDAPPLSETPQAIASGSLRQRMQDHRTNAQCAALSRADGWDRPGAGKLQCRGRVADRGWGRADQCLGHGRGPGVCGPSRVQAAIARQTGAIHPLPGRETADLCLGPGRGEF